MLLCYIAGPYRAPTESQIVENIRLAEMVAIKYWKLGFSVICPHKNTAFFGGILPDSVWLEGDFEIIRRCDFIVMLPTWKMSQGAKMEHDFALSLGKSVIYEGNWSKLREK